RVIVAAWIGARPQNRSVPCWPADCKEAAPMRCPTLVLFAVACLMACAQTANQPHTTKSTASNATASNAVPEPAIPAVLSAFDRYEVVAMPVGHGMKDINDFILAL